MEIERENWRDKKGMKRTAPWLEAATLHSWSKFSLVVIAHGPIGAPKNRSSVRVLIQFQMSFNILALA